MPQGNEAARIDAYIKAVRKKLGEGDGKLLPEAMRELRILHMQAFPHEHNELFRREKERGKKKKKK